MLHWLFSDPLPVGAPAPDFSLPDQDGKPVSLAALRGHNVVLVYGVNRQNAQSHAKFVDKSRLPFPLLVGPGGIPRFAQRGTPDADVVLSHAS